MYDFLIFQTVFFKTPVNVDGCTSVKKKWLVCGHKHVEACPLCLPFGPWYTLSEVPTQGSHRVYHQRLPKVSVAPICKWEEEMTSRSPLRISHIGECSELTHQSWEHSQAQLSLKVQGINKQESIWNIKCRIKAKLQLWLKFTLDNTNMKKVLLPIIFKNVVFYRALTRASLCKRYCVYN